ncbi:LANO_0E12530g1_1 [Lachancea nothofagi CBS 11611]|uniref:phosphatidylinositol-3,4,5-trisphosphate 3-phosphatase n=1 Tax=Lachancea nothofagi CBS 11611 TaxID=1266666 RepID=A0A1G4JY70_9SACH|nr:LANO_0E12530g1_1 [Lachancea nothofagi CBS 11611]
MPLSFSNLTPESIIRSIYSSPINVHKNDLGLTLDLSYVTQQLIVCSYPVVNYPQLIYRNSLRDLILYLNSHHGAGNWKIYNFKVERGNSDYSDENLAALISKEDTLSGPEALYTSLNLHGNQINSLSPLENSNLSSSGLLSQGTPLAEIHQYIERYGWLDHSPPPFLLLQHILDDMHSYLTEDNHRVALLHCKIGKGRSGCVVVAYLMKFMNCSLQESRDIFMNGRFRAGITRGVTIRSQLRYLGYHELFLQLEKPIHRPKVLNGVARSRFKITTIEITNPLPHLNLDTKACSIFIKMHVYNRARNGLLEVFDTDYNDVLFDDRSHQRLAAIDVGTCVAESDIRFSFGLRFKSNEFIDSLTKMTSVSHCWLNLYWETLICSRNASLSSYTLEELRKEQIQCRDGKSFALFTIKWDELDGVKGTQNKGLKLFEYVTLRWQLL